MHISYDVQGVISPAQLGRHNSSFRSVGVTGGIGSGKSFVCTIFQTLGVPVYNADNRAKWLIAHHPTLVEAIKELLGTSAYTQDGTYNTAYVSNLVFKDATLLKRLNDLVHPIVQTDSETWFKEIRESKRFSYAIKEAAIMHKAGEGNSLDAVIVVTAPASVRIQRVLERDIHRSLEEVKAIIDRQMTEEERLIIANYRIQNDSNVVLLPQVLAIHQQLIDQI